MENKEEFTMEELLAQENKHEIKVKDIVEGEVLEVKDKYAKINLNTFTEGTIYLDHYTNDKEIWSLRQLLKVGDVVKAEVTKVSDGENSDILLSRLNLLKHDSYLEAKEKFPVLSNVEAKVVKILENKGYILSNGQLEMFMSLKDLKDYKLQKGELVCVKIISYDDEKENAYVSRYAVIREERQHAYEEKQKAHQEYLEKKEAEHLQYVKEREDEYNSYKVGDILTGTVSSIVPYGAFVKFNKVQGLIRLKDVDHTFIKSAADVLNVGDKVQVQVVLTSNGKLELSRKALMKTPYEEYCLLHKVSDTVKGKVINKMPFGVLVELAPNVTGLLHKSEFSWNPNDNLMASLLIGDEIEVSIIKEEVDKKRISLSRKPLLDNPWARVETKVGDKVLCKITEVREKEFVVSAFGVDGIIPFNQVDGGEKRLKATDLYQVSDDINAVVIEFEPKKWVLVLSEKKYKELEEREQFERYMKEEQTEQSTTLGDIFQEQLK